MSKTRVKGDRRQYHWEGGGQTGDKRNETALYKNTQTLFSNPQYCVITNSDPPPPRRIPRCAPGMLKGVLKWSAYLWVIEEGVGILLTPPSPVPDRPAGPHRPLSVQQGLAPTLLQREERRVHKMADVQFVKVFHEVLKRHPGVIEHNKHNGSLYTRSGRPIRIDLPSAYMNR